ncbi:hypothetical protein [Candidatus Marimicrobium litorale]|uniref:Uncharacterized protein n=1 Tax=Candidatus Marimicrobium litorale TaxID=2518991 RepID=A0ABT3T0N8_9GAMM|nr:hypothetical protein [Candidatus Marimicrobium litorale]MCX2975817.1 hypothetical protein [Candidatus Marimicrobium litorale]
MTNGHRYIVKTAFFTLFFLGLLAAFNATINPYQLLPIPAITGLNEKKTDIFFHLAVAKPYHFYAGDKANVVLGSSRAGTAIDPNHPLLSERGFYNYATPGGTPEYDYLKLRSAIASGPVQHVYYFVDFFTFNTYYELPSSTTDAFRKRTAFGTVRFIEQAVEDLSASLLSYYATRDSVSTMRKQSAAESGAITVTTLRPNGLWDLSFASERQTEKAFASTENGYLHQNWFLPASGKFSLHETPSAPNQSFSYFKATLVMAQEHNLDMTVVILPVHARLLENLDNVGLWPNFEYWKRQLVTINEKIAIAQNTKPFPLWDFNGYSEVSTEPVNDEDPPRWFYDSAHPHVNTGNRILNIVSGQQVDNFGKQLTLSNVDDWLALQRSNRESYRTANASLADDIQRRVAKFRKRNQRYIEAPPKTAP